jgi:hypothetical protein
VDGKKGIISEREDGFPSPDGFFCARRIGRFLSSVRAQKSPARRVKPSIAQRAAA